MNKASLAAEIREHGLGYVVDNASPVKYALLQGFILGLLDRPDALARPEGSQWEETTAKYESPIVWRSNTTGKLIVCAAWNGKWYQTELAGPDCSPQPRE